jgi:hypothetical protein
MGPYEFRKCLQDIGWSQRSAAARLNIRHTRTERMATGRYPAPPGWLPLSALYEGIEIRPEWPRPVE